MIPGTNVNTNVIDSTRKDGRDLMMKLKLLQKRKEEKQKLRSNRRLFVEALRSGEYHQCFRSMARTINGEEYYCALGVAQMVFCPKKIGLGMPSREVLEAILVKRSELSDIIQLNDYKRYTFGEIANYLETKWKL